MQIQPDLALQAVLKSLTEVIAPAVDRGDKMAQEQIGLVIGLLTLVKSRLPIAFAYDCDELARLTELAEAILPAAGSAPLQAALERGAVTLERAQATPADLSAAIEVLRSAVSDAAAALASRGDTAGRAAVRALLDASRAQLVRERSWVLMQGWESDPDSLPDLATLVAAPAGKGTDI